MARKLHTTREGEQKPIAAMDNEHLTNTCGIAHKACMQTRAAARHSASALDSLLMGVVEISPREAADRIAATMEEFHPYFIEAYLRGLEGPRLMLQDIYNRKAPADVPVFPSLAAYVTVEE